MRLAVRVAHVLAEDAVPAVVDDQPGNVELVLACRGELGDRVQRAAVAGHGEDRQAGLGDGRPQGGGEGVAETTGALRRVHGVGPAGVEGRPGPVGKDRHVPEGGRPGGQGRAHRRQHLLLQVEPLCRDPGADPVEELPDPAGGLVAVPRGDRFQGLQQGLQREPRVRVDAEGRVVGLELPGVGVDLHDRAARLERVVVRGEFAQPGAHDQQDVGILEEVRGVPVLHPGLQRERVGPGEGALAAEGGDDRDGQLLGELPQLAGGVRADDSASRDDHRALGAGQQVRGDGGQFGPRRQLLRGGVHRGDHRDAGRLPQHVVGDLHVDGPEGDRQRRAPGLGDRGGDLRLGAGAVHGLDDPAEGRGLVLQLMEVTAAAPAESVGRDLAADRQHRRGGGGRLLQRGQRGQRAGPGGQQERGGLTGDPAVRVRREGRVVLDPQADGAQVGPAQRVEDRQDVLAGQGEDGGRAQPGERLHDHVPAVAAGRRVQGRLRLRGRRAEHQVVVVGHCVRAFAICRDMMVVSS